MILSLIKIISIFFSVHNAIKPSHAPTVTFLKTMTAPCTRVSENNVIKNPTRIFYQNKKQRSKSFF